MERETITLCAVGDVSPNREKPEELFALSAHVLRKADISFSQLETSFSEKDSVQYIPHSPARSHPRQIAALTYAGFDVISYASNHALDCGYEVFLETIDRLRQAGMEVIGAGKDLGEARKPAILERKGTNIGFLAYNSILPLGYDADTDRPGTNPLRAYGAYQQFDPQVGTPPKIISFCEGEDLARMREDIERSRPRVDMLVVSMHYGVHFVPAMIAMYQKEASYAAIDAGADLILGHHAHILKGIEVYKGKVIFYGLGNFAMEHHLRPPGTRRGMLKAYREQAKFYGLRSEPGWEKYPYQSEARNTIVAKATIVGGKIDKVTYLPALIDPSPRPEILTRQDPRSQDVYNYVEHISRNQNLKVNFSWEGDEILISK